MAYEIDIEAMETRIVDRLRPLEIPTVESWGALELKQRDTFRLPAAIVLFNSVSFEDSDILGGVGQDGVALYDIFVIAESLRGPGEARKGPRGSYETIRRIMGRLGGYEAQSGYPIVVKGVTRLDEGDRLDRIVYGITVQHDIRISTAEES